MRTHSFIVLAFFIHASLSCSANHAASPPAQGDRPPVRVVPQVWYERQGLVDPTGKLAVARGGHSDGLRIIDLKRERVAWVVQPEPVGWGGIPSFAFSSDGRWLAICQHVGGRMLDLVADREVAAPWLKGLVPIFSPDDKLLYVAANSKDEATSPGWDWQRYVDTIRVYDRQGKAVRSFPLQMNMVGRLSFSEDSRALVVDGGTGVGLENRAGGTFTPSRQIINLETGAAELVAPPNNPEPRRQFGGVGLHATMPLQAMPAPTVESAQRVTGMLWDVSTHSLAVMAEGGMIKLWNIRDGQFAATAGKGKRFNNVTFLRPGFLVGTAWHEGKTLPPELAHMAGPRGHGSHLVTLIKLPEGTIQPLAISESELKVFQSSPDGTYFAGITFKADEQQTSGFQVWDAKGWTLIGEVLKPGQRIHAYQWTADGRFLIVLFEGEKAQRRWEFFTPQGASEGVAPEPADFHNALGVFSPSGNLVAIQVESGRENGRVVYRTVVRRSRTGEEIAAFPAIKSRAQMLFLDEQRLLVAGSYGAPIRMLRISDQKVLWETASAGEARKLTWERGWSKLVVNYSSYNGAEVLSIDDGRRSPAGAEEPSWYNPVLLRGGQLALDPLPGTTQIMLKETVSGKLIATFASFADPEWIIYTPDGLWTGSENALDRTAFYRAAEPLTPEETAARRQPETIKTRLAAAFR